MIYTLKEIKSIQSLYVDHTEQSPTILSLCPGILGLERGVERVIGPLRTIAYVEIEAAIIENLVAGMEAGRLVPAPVWANLKTFPWRYLRGKVFLLLGGYPCQPFSTAGLRKGEEDPRHLWPYIEFGISTIRPVCCFFENVAGHLSLGFEKVNKSLRAMGYAVEAGIYTAEEVGAPHKRARLFILAILDDADSRRRGRELWELSRQAAEERRSKSQPKDRPQNVRYATKELAYSFGDGAGADSGSSIRPGRETESKEQRQERDEIQRERNGSDVGNCGTDVADPQGVSQRESTDDNHTIAIGGATWAKFSGGGNRWPVGPARRQHEWEEPRTIESGLGCTVDGYDFREDLLRALGNSVVEQQAELAFRDLLRKHLTH